MSVCGHRWRRQRWRRQKNILMCAPTGAGKTNVAMLAILHTLSLYRDAATGAIDVDKFKIIYVAPMKVCLP